MLKINKLADYGLMVMSCLAHHRKPLNTPEIAAFTHLSVHTVSKVLKCLTRHGLLLSKRGMQGGYRLALPAENITLNHMLAALEEDLAVTECAQGQGVCKVEHFCGIRHNWKMINKYFQSMLSKITLADMLGRLPKDFSRLQKE